jgi:hypothetical protein
MMHQHWAIHQALASFIAEEAVVTPLLARASEGVG